jgi:hypothetical protein
VFIVVVVVVEEEPDVYSSSSTPLVLVSEDLDDNVEVDIDL